MSADSFAGLSPRPGGEAAPEREKQGSRDGGDHRALLAQALEAVERMQEKLAESERAQTEPIAIIGAGCRFPGGVDSPDRFWELLSEGRNAVTRMPAERWAGVPDEAPFGGFLDHIDLFDADFFGISPREAESMDPQQRLVLEVAWEALEHAGVTATGLRGSQTGIFIGATTTDYGKLAMSGDPATLDAYTATGNALNVIAGRISYLLGLNGPAMAVDTACSSSVVAAHLACHSLRSGECDLALAGGVNALIAAESFICFQRWGMMSPKGQCRAFDASADGFVRAEGCGVVVLKRLGDAQRDGDAIIAVIRSSAVNQDGASSGLTVPNGLAQQAVIRRALESAKIDGARIGYVEAHGTGTNIGDPIEMEAIGTVLCRSVQRKEPLRVGSVKSNLGHMESAAGICGLIKAALCLERGAIPRSLHFEQPNPRIDWKRYAVEVPTKMTAWPRGATPRLAAVSGFGFSGTNGHIILEEAPAGPESSSSDSNAPHLLCLSARNPAALSELAGRYADWFGDAPGCYVSDACRTAAGRVPFFSRVAVVARSTKEFSNLLRSYYDGNLPTGIVSGHAGAGKGSVSFLFTGQGSQYPGMGADLYEQEPLFRAAIDHCTDLLRPSLEHALRDVMFQSQHSRLLSQTAYTQPALFALEWALAELWRSWGISPVSVLGHSVGEYVAACVAGIMKVDDGTRLIAKRAQLMQALPAGGGMTSVLSPEARVRSLLIDQSPQLAIAAVNSPESAVVSGPVAGLELLEAHLAREGTKFTRLDVSHAFHSSLMEPMLEAFATAARGIQYAPPSCTFLSNLYGRPINAGEVDGNYWVRHVREAVRFADCAKYLRTMDGDLVVEIGPAPVLIGLAQQTVPSSGARWLPSLRPGRGGPEQMLESVGTAFVAGHSPLLNSVVQNPEGARRLRLPTYPFQRRRHWLPDTKNTNSSAGLPPTDRLLGTELDLGSLDGRRRWEQLMSLKRFPFVDDHRVQGIPIVPATAYIEMMLQAARCHLGDSAVRITNIDIHRAILLRADDCQKVQLEVEPADDGRAHVRIFSRRAYDADSTWQLNVAADVECLAMVGDRPSLDELSLLRERCQSSVDGGEFYRLQAGKGNQWGRLFQGVRELWASADEALARVEVPEPLLGELENYRFHPAVSDAAGHVLVGTISLEPSDGPMGGAFVGGGVGEARFYSSPTGSVLWCYARRRPSPDGEANVLVGDVTVFDDTGALVSETIDARLWYLDDAERANVAGYDDWLYRIDWEKVKPVETGKAAGKPERPIQWTILPGRSAVGRSLGSLLAREGENVTCLESPAETDLEGAAGTTRVVLDLRFLDLQQGDFEAATAGPLPGVQTLVKLLADAGHGQSRLWIVTSGAVAVTEGERDVCPAQALAWGVGRTIAVEHSESWGGLIDLDPTDPEESAAALIAWIQRADAEDQAAFRGADTFVPRLARQPVHPKPEAFKARADASYLVTGGLGGLGFVVAERLAERGAGHLLLASRRQFPPRTEWNSWSGTDERVRTQIDAIKRMEALGCSVSIAAIDVSDAANVARQLQQWSREHPPIRGVIHAAGIMQYEAIVEHSRAAMQNIVRSKAASAWVLHSLLTDAPLDFFVMYSSASSLLSSPFMSSYAAANTSLDALAALRRAHGLPALSINWGTWREAGMLLDFDDDRGDVKLKGVGTLSNSEGLGVLEYLLRCEVSQAGVMRIDWPRWQSDYAAFSTAPFLRRFMADQVQSPISSSAVLSAAKLQAAEPVARNGLVEQFLIEQVGRIFKLKQDELDVTSPLIESGMDSLMAVELRNAIDATLGVPLPMVRLVEGPSITTLTGEILEQFSRAKVRESVQKAESPYRAADEESERASELLARLDQLSEEEIESLIEEMGGSAR